MFRGYTQQDSQEFLRYFMDQLHEELREPRIMSHEDEENEMEGRKMLRKNYLQCLCSNFYIVSIELLG